MALNCESEDGSVIVEESTAVGSSTGETTHESVAQKKTVEVPAIKLPPARRKPAYSGLSILTEDQLPEWDALVESSPQCSIFCKSWWLKACCGAVRVLGYFDSGRLIAGIPLYYERHAGLRISRMPKLTQTWGVVMTPLPGKMVTVQSREAEILDVFAARLVQEKIFVQAFHPSIQNWLPFHWRGFTQTTHYTYVLDELGSIDKLWDGLAQVRRTNIRKARRFGIVVKECSPETVFLSSTQTFTRQGKECSYRLDYLQRLYDAARSKDAGVCLAAEDRDGKLHAAIFFAWDSKRGYHLAAGHDSSLGDRGGPALLTWSLIEYAAARTAVFDFEGSMEKQVEASFRSFGAHRIGYNRIAKAPRWLRTGLCLMGRPSI